MSTVLKHTPGPWVASMSGLTIEAPSMPPIEFGKKGKTYQRPFVICEPYHTSDVRSYAAQKADTLLMAAAPDMLAALLAQEEFETLNQIWNESSDDSSTLRATIMEARSIADKLRAAAIAKATGKEVGE